MTEEGREQSPRDAPIGGQAVLEGVMMRGVSTWAVAVRKPAPEQFTEDCRLDPREAATGPIEVVSEPLVSWVTIPYFSCSESGLSRVSFGI